VPCFGQQLTIYPAVEALKPGAGFKVRVRIPGQAWKDLPTYAVAVADGGHGTFLPRETSFGYFDFRGRVDVEITGKRPFAKAGIRPLSYNIRPQIAGRTITFSLDQPRNLCIDLDGDIFHNLQLFAGAPETSIPDKADTNTIYYGPGVHAVGTVRVGSGKQVYLAGGAVVEGQFLIDHAAHVRISGRGILYQPSGNEAGYHSRHDALRIDFSRDVRIQGLIVIPNTYTVLMGSSRDVEIRDLKSFSAGGNNDGIDVFCSENVVIDHVFMRNSDDCIAIYGHRWRYYGNTRNVTVSHSSLWADVAHPILVGTHGDPSHPDTLENLYFTDIDILDHHENQIDYQGCMSLNAGDSNLIRHVRFEDIRVEDFRKGQLVNLRVMFNKKYNTAPGAGIEDVLFKNVTYTGTHASLSVIAGYDDRRPVKDILFQNLVINGRMIADDMPGKPGWYKTSDMAGFFVGEHVDGLRFVGPGGGRTPSLSGEATGQK
jgi:hypothetical protein